MDGFSLLWIYNIKNGQMSHKDDYTSTLDLSARTEIKAGGKTITGFDLSWKRSSFFRHEVSVLVGRWGGTVTPPHHVSTYSPAAWDRACGRLTRSDPGQRMLPLGLYVGAWVTASPIYLLAHACVLFYFVFSVLFCWADWWVMARTEGVSGALVLPPFLCPSGAVEGWCSTQHGPCGGQEPLLPPGRLGAVNF